MARAAWTGGGFLAVGVGGVGVVVPGLPTTVFFIIAAWCFSHSSPRFEQWVLNLPRIGPMVRDHRAGLGMPRRAKRVAIGMMWVAVTVSGLLLRDRVWVAVSLVALAMVGTWYIARRVPTREVELARREGRDHSDAH
ncbi:MAG TPA: DUF454 domain-containing protein [Acidimicrobiaceae bacterium]|nr:DUF454 domain-containing protein [Acidimicrobiaceae bacterium]